MNKVKHLEMIQSIINRLAGNSFLIKGWFLTISLAEIGFYISNSKKQFIVALIIFNALVFWVFDSFYLSAERKFRCLFKDVANPSKNLKAFTMDRSKYKGQKYSVTGAMFSFPTWLIYVSSILCAIIIYIFTAWEGGEALWHGAYFLAFIIKGML
jgi:hypothetical protein